MARSKAAVPKPISAEAMFAAAAHVRNILKPNLLVKTTTDVSEIFKPAQHPFKPPEATMAMDSVFADSIGWAGGASSFAEGVQFMGWSYLAAEAQRGEVRAIVDTIGDEMTRKWVKIKASSEDEKKGPKIAQIQEELVRLKVRKRFNQAAKGDGYFGRGQLFLDYGKNDDADELKKPIGDGTEEGSKAKVSKRKIQRLKYVEAMWSYPMDYNAVDPLADDWYMPKTWLVMNRSIHASRMLTFIGRPLPDIMKPAYSFGGLSLTQVAKPYIDNWLRTRQSVSDLVKGFSVFVLETDMAGALQGGVGGSDPTSLIGRLDLFNALRDNAGIMAINSKAGEKLTNVAAQLAGLADLQAQSQEHMAAITHIPLVKFLGIQPMGLNADSDGILRCWYEYIKSCQEILFEDNFRKVLNLIQLGLWGKVDPDITFEFVSLREMDTKEKAEIEKLKAETDNLLIESDIISREEARARIAKDSDSDYDGLNVMDLPEITHGDDIDIGSEENDNEQQQDKAA